ncbi:MAG: hypothetical protein HKP14_04110, partial [Bacteroidia bacterium]|nr:hypothetical protein [Bacteroidia bacterium]
MLKNFLLLELKYSLKQPMVYIFLGLITLLTFGITSSGIVFFDTIGNANINAPHSITVYTTFLTLFGLMIAAAFFNGAA